MKAEDKLSPEQSKAFQEFKESLQRRLECTVARVLPEHVFVTNSKVFIEGKICRKTLPKDSHWIWNQSKSQKTVSLGDGSAITMYKLNPRRKNKDQTQRHPAYKLWIISTVCQRDEDVLNFLWCEKGRATIDSPEPLVPVLTPIGRIQPEEISLEQLVFLREFMEPESAMNIFDSPPPS